MKGTLEGGVAGQQAPRTGLVTNSRMLRDSACVLCVCACACACAVRLHGG